MSRSGLKNNAATNVSSSVAIGDTTINVVSAAALPTITTDEPYFYVTLLDSGGVPEIVKVTAVVGNALTVVRGQDGTVARAFANNAVVSNNVIAAIFKELAPSDAPTFTGNVTLSSGIANGIPYLNASKVLTSGSALTFDGSKLGVGISSAAGVGHFYGSAPVVYVQDSVTGASIGISANAFASNATAINTYNNYPIAFGINNSEAMRLTSTGLGIGTSNAATKLDVNGVITVRTNDYQFGRITTNNVSASVGGLTLQYNDTGTFRDGLVINGAGSVGIGTSSPTQKLTVAGSIASNAGFFIPYNGATATGYLGYGTSLGTANDIAIRCDTGNILFGFSGTTKATLDSSGNLGLGVTPSASFSGVKAFQFGQRSVLASNNYTQLADNMVFTSVGSSANYLINGYATMYLQGGSTNGQHQWYIAPSGTAGSPISYTQAMTLDASGNLMVGATTTPGGRLTVNRNVSGATDYTTEQLSVFNNQTGASGNQATIGFHLNNANWGPNTTYARVSAVLENGTTGSTALVFGTAADGAAVTAPERLRIDSAGNFMLTGPAGTGQSILYKDSTGGSLRIAGGNSGDNGSNITLGGSTSGTYRNLTIFRNGTSETARIDASGNLGLGVTPTAWTNTGKAIDIGLYSAVHDGDGGSGGIALHNNSYEYAQGKYRYKNNYYATMYRGNYSGQHQWFIAPTGIAGQITTITNGRNYTITTAGGNFTAFGALDNNVGTVFTATSSGTATGGGVTENINFTQAMTLDASGNLGVGQTLPSYRIDTALGNPSSSTLGWRMSTGNIGNLMVGMSQNSTNLGTASTSADIYTTASLDLRFGTNNTERLRIDSAGNLFLNQGYMSFGNNGYIRADVANKLAFQGGSSGYVWRSSGNDFDHMTLDATGNLQLGLSNGSAAVRLNVQSGGTTSGTYGSYIQNSAATLLQYIRSDGAYSTGTAAASPYNLTTAVASNVVVDSSGLLYRSTSSLKYKKEIQDSVHGLSDLMKLRSVTYKGKNDGDKVFGGLIAEEVHEAGLTEFVEYSEDGSPDALAYSHMVSLCIKAIQEQQAKILALEAKIAQLVD